MKWVTRPHIHLDRVACPWLIRRFVDREAEFLFVPLGKGDSPPEGAAPFAIPGVELGPRDAHGTCFDKILRKYHLDDPALALLAKIVISGMNHAGHTGDRTDIPALEGIGLDAISQGMMLSALDDADNLEKSMAVYDALYAYCKAQTLMEQDPSLAEKGVLERVQLLKTPIRAALSGGRPPHLAGWPT